MTPDVLVPLISLFATIFTGIFSFCRRLWTRVDNLEKRLEQAEDAIFELEQVSNMFGLAYESLRLQGLNVVDYARTLTRQLNQTEPSMLANLENRETLDKLTERAQKAAREASKRRQSL